MIPNSWFLVFNLKSHIGNKRKGKNVYDLQNPMKTMNQFPHPKPMNFMNMTTTITPPLATGQRLNEEAVIFSDGHVQHHPSTDFPDQSSQRRHALISHGDLQRNRLEPTERDRREQIHRQQPNQLSLPLADVQRDISSGENIIRSPIKVDVRVQFLPKKKTAKHSNDYDIEKPKTKMICDQNNIIINRNINNSSIDDVQDDDDY